MKLKEEIRRGYRLWKLEHKDDLQIKNILLMLFIFSITAILVKVF